jgi:hypothetical protein
MQYSTEHPTDSHPHQSCDWMCAVWCLWRERILRGPAGVHTLIPIYYRGSYSSVERASQAYYSRISLRIRAERRSRRGTFFRTEGWIYKFEPKFPQIWRVLYHFFASMLIVYRGLSYDDVQSVPKLRVAYPKHQSIGPAPAHGRYKATSSFVCSKVFIIVIDCQ